MIGAVIAAEAPDVVVILEATGWETGDRLASLAGISGLAHYVLGKSQNSRYHLAVLSKQPLTGFENHPEGFRTTLLKVPVYSLAGGFTIYGLHLHSKDEDKRLLEIAHILTTAKDDPNALLIGDFNALAPDDPYDRAALLKTFQERGIKKFGINRLRFDVISAVTHAGYIDLLAQLNTTGRLSYTVPTPSNIDIAHATQLRLDYAFATPRLAKRCIRASVLRTDNVNVSSDHFPILVEFSM